MNKEIWKPIFGYEGLYEISNYGQIKRLNRDKRCRPFRLIKPLKKADGHVCVDLSKNGSSKRRYIHTIVLETFVEARPQGMECRHLDGNPENNKIENLKWGSKSENTRDSVKHGTHWLSKNIQKGSMCKWAKLNEFKVRVIKKLLIENNLNIKEISEIFRVSNTSIYDILMNRTWKHIKE